MLELNKRRKKALEDLGVVVVYLFGSQAQGIENPLSDYDFGVLTKEPKKLKNRTCRSELYNKLLDIFENAIGKPTNIDIVFLDEADIVLKFHVIRSGRLLFEIPPKSHLEFKERVILEHADFEPYRQFFEKTTLQKLGLPNG